MTRALALATLAVVIGGTRSAAQRPEISAPGPASKRTAPTGPTPAAPALTRIDVENWLDGFLPYAMQRGDIAGAVVVVVKDGQILLEKGFGYADVKRGTPVNPKQTLFRPGSVSKLFTWTAAMQLAEQGKLDLDHDVSQYLDFKIPAAFGQPISLRHLMTHTAGFEEVNKNVFSNDSTGVESLQTFLKDWMPTRIFPPGQVPAYSNYAAALTGYIIQRVSGEPFDDYIERHIFTPLRMEHSSFRQPLPARLTPGMASGYDLASGEAKAYEMVVPAPAGSLAATGDDMARFMIAHLQNGRFEKAHILSPETAKMMHGAALTIIPRVNRMVLGFYETNRNGRRAIAHAGDTYWFHSDLHLFIDDGVGIFVSMNSGGKEDATSAIRSSLFEQFADRYFPGETSTARVDPKTAIDHARLMAGRYDNSRRSQSNFMSVLNLFGQANVTVNEDTTISLSLLQGLSGQPKRWREAEPFIWREVDGKNWLAARVLSGKVVMFSGDEISPFMMFLPTPWWRSSVWLTWLLGASVLILLLTVVMWPVTALLRRHYHGSNLPTGRPEATHRLVRIMTTMSVLIVAAWGGTMQAMVADLSYMTSKLDSWIWLLQLLTLIAFVGATAVALWQVRVAWAGNARWPAKSWSLILLGACLTLLWVAFVFKLTGLTVHY